MSDKPVSEAIAAMERLTNDPNLRQDFSVQDAQDFLESGTPGRKATEDGWLNRSLQAQPDAVVELVTHPGRADDPDFPADTLPAWRREWEAGLLASGALAAVISVLRAAETSMEGSWGKKFGRASTRLTRMVPRISRFFQRG